MNQSLNKSPLIGVTPLWDAARQSIWMLPDYLDGIKAAGGLPVVLPLDLSEEDAERIVETCDGFLFTGGQDVSPSLYGMEDATGTIVSSPERDQLEALLLSKALEADKPIMGICRGLQFINAFLGGTVGVQLLNFLLIDERRVLISLNFSLKFLDFFLILDNIRKRMKAIHLACLLCNLPWPLRNLIDSWSI